MRKPTVHFNAISFNSRHGHMPRGRALWIFFFSDAPLEPWIAGQKQNDMQRRTYSEAKAMATEEANRRGVTSVFVDPQPL